MVKMHRTHWFSSLFCILLLATQGADCAGQTLTSSNLPIFILETAGTIPDEPKVQGHLGIIYNGESIRNDVSDPYTGYDGEIRIERRGSSSQMFPKEQFGFELQTTSGRDTSVALLGLPTEEDWILFGPYNDKSLMRDVLAYKMARDMGRYAPRTRYCELIWNGEYRGVYVLIEKIKRDRNRVDISDLDPDDLSGDDITGGYILKIDKGTGNGGMGFVSAHPPQHASNQRIFFQFEYPEGDALATQQMNYISQFVANMEAALAAENFDDPHQGYRAYLDPGSFADYMIMNEVTKNVDGYRLSTFFHKDRNSRGGKIRMGPVWDFNLGFGNANYCTSGEPHGFVHDFNAICPDDTWVIPFWWKRLLQDPFYKRMLSERWQSLRQNKFATDVIHAYIDSVATVLNQEARQRNFEKWNVLGQWIWPNYAVLPTYDGEVSYLKDWIADRMDWLDAEWGEGFVTSAEQTDSRKVVVYMSPEDDAWVLETILRRSGVAEIGIADMHGKTVYRQSLHVDAGSFRMNIEGAHLGGGFYIISTAFPGQALTRHKVVKTK